mmetsp:Transcript_34773/g.108159  ORF Transcript_34773/g.108159 Transcript_34773/m.108159 type:complete len:243 (-) Transcript_34773:354-1082(-)
MSQTLPMSRSSQWANESSVTPPGGVWDASACAVRARVPQTHATPASPSLHHSSVSLLIFDGGSCTRSMSISSLSISQCTGSKNLKSSCSSVRLGTLDRNSATAVTVRPGNTAGRLRSISFLSRGQTGSQIPRRSPARMSMRCNVCARPPRLHRSALGAAPSPARTRSSSENTGPSRCRRLRSEVPRSSASDAARAFQASSRFSRCCTRNRQRDCLSTILRSEWKEPLAMPSRSQSASWRPGR